MCSTTGELLARLGQAIDDLAAESREQAHAAAAGDVADRLAGAWAMLAELDPELAKRLAGYHAAPE
jgi:hypothetical protein